MGPRSALGRLTQERDFQRVYRKGIRRSARLMTLYMLRSDASTVRVGLAVGRRFGGAVARNRLRRRLREAVRAACKGVAEGVDLIVVPRAEARSAPYDELRGEVTATLRASGLLTESAGGNDRP